MRYLIASDIHGGIDGTKYLYDLYKKEKFDKFIILGDILYHGPRNDLPSDYKPKEVIKLLNELKDEIIAIKGNCEAYVDEMVLDFEIHDHLDLRLNNLDSHLEHGHFLDDYLGKPDIILFGHTHVLLLEKKNDIIMLNPGSVTLPKNGNPKSYAIWDDNKITIYNLSGEEIKKYEY